MTLLRDITIPSTVADNIVLASITDHCNLLKSELDAFYSGEKYLHESDAHDYHILIKAFEKLIGYYGG
jgi:hypothetical protein